MDNLIRNIELTALSSYFYNQNLLDDTILKANDFYDLKLGKIFYLMQKLHKDGLPVDESFILKKIDEKERVIFENLFVEILTTNSLIEIENYEVEIKEEAQKRKLEKLLSEAKNNLKNENFDNISKKISENLEILNDDNTKKEVFNFRNFGEIEPKKADFFLEDFLPIQKREINILSANGGSGKSFISLLLALKLSENNKVFAWFSEDEIEITKNRENILKKSNILNPNYENLVICGRETEIIRFVEKNNRKLEINNKFNIIKKQLKDFNIVILDPLIGFFGGDENDNGDARFFMSLLNKWCSDESKTIILIHHNNKADKDGNSTSRGASAFIDACRMQYSIHTDKENNRYRLAKIEKTNHFSKGKKEYKIKVFDTEIVFENKNDEKAFENYQKSNDFKNKPKNGIF